MDVTHVHVQKGYGPAGTLEGSDNGLVRKWGTGGPGYNIKAEFNPRKHEFGMKYSKITSDQQISTVTVHRTAYLHVCVLNLA